MGESKGEPIVVHRLLAHTADLRAELSAPDLAGLCAEAVALVRELLVGAGPVERRTTKRFQLEGDDDAERFFRFVREMIYLADSETFLPAGCTLAGPAAELTGERFDPARHVAERQLKAVTRHRYRFERTPDGLVAELVFDL